MNVEERVRYLLRAALRAEGEGDRQVARALRRMAEEALPVVRKAPRPVASAPGGCGD